LVIDTDTPMQVVDAYGGTEGLNRPGARYLVAGHRSTDHAKLVTAAAMRDEAYRQRELEDGERWRGGETPQPATDAGDVDPRQAAYDAYDREMAEAWRKGR
jgi:hypothetical protein